MKPFGDLKAKDDLFVIEIGDDAYLVYAPLRRVLFEANGMAVSEIRRIVCAGEDTNELRSMRWFLEDRGLLTSPVFRSSVDVERPFRPQACTFSLTSDCNLRCLYCYAFGGEKPQTMSAGIAGAALDMVLRQAAECEMTQFRITFHGGGEPLVAWPLLQETTEYAQELGRQYNIQIKVNLVTNGTLINEPVAKWLAQNISIVTLSIDGPQGIQDIQRPRRRGQGSFAAVMRGVRFMRQCGVKFSIRSTITNLNVQRMVEMVDFFATEVMGDVSKQLHFEPVEEVGRARSRSIGKLDALVFIDEYKKASQRANELGINLHYSGDKLNHLQAVFCGADGEIFCVLPDGAVSACTRVTRNTDPGATVFIYGKYDARTGSFCIDNDKLISLRQLGVWAVERCQNCFCKWHCAGHCPNSRLTGGTWAMEDFTCRIVRELTKWKLLQKLTAGSVGFEVSESC